MPSPRRRAGSVGGSGRIIKKCKGEKGRKGKKEKEVLEEEKRTEDLNTVSTPGDGEEKRVAIKPEPFPNTSVYSTPTTNTCSLNTSPLPAQNFYGSEIRGCQTIAPFAQMVGVEELQEREERREVIVKVEPWEED